MIGFFIALVQANLRLPLRLPGWRGLIWLTPLIVTRASNINPISGSITSLSAAGFSLLLGVRNDPYDWFFYLTIGEVLDIAYHLNKRWRRRVWFWSVVAGVAHSIEPLARTIIDAGNVWPYGALSAGGPVYPLVTHLMFGAIAGLLGAFAALKLERFWRSR